jgi:DNA-binding transcriptional LysR family regulator
VEHGGYARAQAPDSSQSTISHHARRLEELLGNSLDDEATG